MKNPASNPYLESFFSDPSSWAHASRGLRRVARAVVGDEATAEDIVQSAWMEALQSPEGIRGFGWMRKLVHNRSIDTLRKRARDPKGLDHGQDLPEPRLVGLRLDAQQAVLRAVQGLPEPYRSTIYMRYFEEQGPKAIAARLQVSEATVKSRLTRAHILLRDRLRSRFETEPGTWSPALLAFSHSRTRLPASAVPSFLSLYIMKKALIIALILALAGGAALTWKSLSPGEPDVESNHNPALTTPAQSKLLQAPTTESRSAQTATVAPLAQQTRKQVDPQTEIAATPAERVFRGRFVLEDEDGNRTPNLSGTAKISARAGSSGRSLNIVVVHGSFTCVLEEDEDRLTFWRLTLGGQPVMRHDEFPLKDLDLEQEHVILVQPTPWIHLDVRDATTGAPLDQVTVRSARSAVWHMYHPSQVDSQHPVATGAASPLHIQVQSRMARSPSVELWVWSPGYAWNRIEWSFRSKGVREVRLVPGGDLEVELSGQIPPAALLRLRTAQDAAAHQGQLVTEWQLNQRSPSILLDGLAPGTYQIGVELPNRRDPLKLATGVASIEAGKQTRITLEVKVPQPVTRVPLAGVLVLPTEWKILKPVLALHAFDQASDGSDSNGRYEVQATEDPTVWTFESDSVTPGRYSVALEIATMKYLHSEAIMVGEQGNSLVRIQVPPPATVSVSVVREDTGESIESARVSWTLIGECGATVRFSHGANRDSLTGKISLRAPVGLLDLSASAKGFAITNLRVRVDPGDNSVTLTLRRASFLELNFEDAGTQIPAPEFSSGARFEPLSGNGKLSSWGSDVPTRLSFTHPGTYRVSFPDLPGYEPIAPFEVHLTAGGTTQYTLLLKPRVPESPTAPR